MTPTLSRRTLAALGVGLLAAACGGDDDPGREVSEAVPLATPLAALPGFDDPTRWRGRTVRVGLWGGEIQQAIAASVLDPFSRLTGAVVTTFAADYDRLASSVAAGEPFVDLMVADLTRVDALLASGTTVEVGEGVVAADRLGPLAARPGGVPAYVYSLAGAVRREPGSDEEGPEGWVAWWDVGRYPSPRSLPASPIGTLEVALLADGVDRGDLYPLDVERALDKLGEVAPSVGERWWRSGDEPVVWMIQEEIALAATWHHRAVAAQLDGRPIEIVWRDAPTVADYVVVPSGAGAADVAHDLIRFALADEVQSVLAYASSLGPAAPGAFAHIAAAQARRLPTSPDRSAELLPLDPAWWSENRESVSARFAEWLAGRGVTA